ncbi:MAG: hypothetical protein FJZ01_10965 [Candidatus Sericytochromatia bacterium]|nr:hypothetical protein [Candidatus Tanganyikabacteria bacterium]
MKATASGAPARGPRRVASAQDLEALRAEREALLAERDFLRANLDATHRELRRAEARKRVLGQVNQLLDDHLFRATVARKIAEVAERYTDLGEICHAVFGLMRELTPLRGALALVDIGERRALVAEAECPATAAEAAFACWSSLAGGALEQIPGAFVVPIFRGGAPVAIVAAWPSKSIGFTIRDTEILSLFAEHMQLPLERGVYLERVRDLVNAKEQFMRMLTHDLRNPLTSILSSLWTVTGDQFGLDAAQEKLLVGNAFRAAQRLNGLLEDLLDLYRLEAGKLDLALKPLDVPGLVREAVDQITPVAREKGLTVAQAVQAELPPVVGDRAKLSRVMSNLLSNAVKYTFEGEVRVEVEVTEPTITVRVRDTGLGIDPEEAAGLFQPFVRTKATAHIKGCGLGLAFCRQMVEAHGGKIWVDSEPGKGSSFNFSLPVTAEVAA